MTCSSSSKVAVKYKNGAGFCVYPASVTTSSSSVILALDTKLCTLTNLGTFLMFVPSISGTTATVNISTKCGALAPLRIATTGNQATASNLTSGSTYFITYDSFSQKFFLQ